ncbi:EAL domain, c-di-GMP-specific phosphodiesterase class I (or its enzymatically inactive variant) [Vogesella sp. LIG4]|nr:EAL domain, c-di-GMP-specific phosphodiesterase class I (or its enzymatically inactive variant) [Vogesella sp. LIG4]
MDKIHRPHYQPIFQMNDVMLGVEVYLLPAELAASLPNQQYETQIKLLRHGLLHVMSDLDSLVRLDVKRLFITISELHLDHARDLLGFLGERCQELGMVLVAQVDVAQRAEAMDAHPVVCRLLSQGGQLALDGYGHYGNSFFQIVATLPSYVKLDTVFLRWCYESKFHGALKDVVRLLENFNCQIIVNGPETALQMQFAYTAGVKYVQGNLLCAPLEIDRLVDEMTAVRVAVNEVA